MYKSWNNKSLVVSSPEPAVENKNKSTISPTKSDAPTTNNKDNEKGKLLLPEVNKDESQRVNTTKLTEEQKEILCLCFNKYSVTKVIKKPPKSRLNASGVREVIYSEPQTEITINEKQLATMFEDANLPLLPKTVSHFYSQLAKQKLKGISFNNLLQIIENQDGALDDQNQYRNIFKYYDRYQKGYFTYEDYQLVCEGIAKDLTQSQMYSTFAEMDLQKNGRVSFQNFVKIMNGSV